MQFQSTLAYLKNPPVGYQQPAVDLVQELEQIRVNITNGYYKNQYHFEAELQRVIYAVHDMHVDLYAGILAAFSFASPFPTSSASIDGKLPPEVFLRNDILDSQIQGWTPSPIIRINNEQASSYLFKFTALNSQGTLEPHADWNQLMANPARDIQSLYSVFSGDATFYPEEYLVFELENGTKIETLWAAIYNEPSYTGPLTTGGDFYNYFVLGLLPASLNETISDEGEGESSDNLGNTNVTNTTAGEPDELHSWASGGFNAYPSNPDIVQKGLSSDGGGKVTGYFLNDTLTAVLSIPSFDMYGDSIGSFSNATAQFITRAAGMGMKRVVIDLQQNTGGTPFLAFDLFQQFFPTGQPYAGSRRRSHPMANILGNATTGIWRTLDPGNPDDEDAFSSLYGDEWVVTPRLNADTGREFSSWEEYFGPRHFYDDTFSLIERYNMTNRVFESSAFDAWTTQKYTHQQPWVAQDIVLLTDGLCSSTCALFVEMMTQDTPSDSLGVRTIAVGGRPSAGPMQTVSGSRGASLYDADLLDNDIDWVQATLGWKIQHCLLQVPESALPSGRAGQALTCATRCGTIPSQTRYHYSSATKQPIAASTTLLPMSTVSHVSGATLRPPHGMILLAFVFPIPSATPPQTLLIYCRSYRHYRWSLYQSLSTLRVGLTP